MKNHTLFHLLIACTCLSSFPGFGQDAASTGTAVYYVATNGNDANPGEMNAPFKTLAGAMNRINTVQGKSAITIYIRQGVYPVNQSIIIAKNQSDISRLITISNYQNETVSFIGGAKLDNAKFKLVDDAGILKRLPPSAQGKVYVTDMTVQGITDFGKMKNYGFGAPAVPSELELFYNDQPLTTARWPNTGLLPIETVLQKWSKSGKEPSVFRYSYDRPNGWAAIPNKWIAGQFAVGWAYDNVPIDTIDVKNQTITLKEAPSYGVYSSKDASTGIISSASRIRGYYFYNILEELDTAGEWYLDREKKKLYLWPTGSMDNAVIEVSLLERPMISISAVNNLTLQGISFSCTRSLVLQVEKSNNITIRKCNFLNAGINAISESLCSNLQITGCVIAHTGDGGISLRGGDRNTLTPSGNVISNCEFYDYSRLHKCYSAAVSLSGVGNSVLDSYIHDAPDQAITYSGNNNVISNNHIANVCYDFSDMGAVYTGRDPLSTGTLITNNFFENIKSKFGMTAAVYIDDGSGGITVSNNIFYNSGSGLGAIHVNGGANNQFTNNVFVDCQKAFSNSPWPDDGWAAYLKKTVKYSDVKPLYLARYTFLHDLLDTVNVKPRNNYITNTILYNTGVLSTGNSYVVKDVFTTRENPGFADINKKDFRIVNPPSAVKSWKGWTPVKFEQIKKN